MKKKILMITLMIGITFVFSVLWIRKKQKMKNPAVAVQKMPVFKTEKISRKTLKEIFMVSGEIIASNSFEIKSKLSGRFYPIERLLSENDFVEKGELLGLIDPEEWKIKKEKTLSAIKVAEVQCKVAKLNLEKRKKEFQRVENLLKEAAVSIQQQKEAESERLEAEQNFSFQEAQLKRAKRCFDQMELASKEAQIIAPFSGLISKKYVNPYEIVKPQSPLFSLTQLSPLMVKVSLSDRLIPYLSKDQTSCEIFGEFEKQSVHASIEKIDPTIDPQTHTITVKIPIKNLENDFKPKMLVQVKVTIEPKKEVLVVPFQAIRDESYVFILENGLAKKKKVNLGLRDEKWVEVLDGVSEKDQIIIGQCTDQIF